MDKTLRIYLSGMISGKEDEARAEFAEAAELIRSKGQVPVNPFENGLDPDESWERHMAFDILTLLGCDAIYQIPGWELSRGARLENEIAALAHIPLCMTRAQMLSDKKTTALLRKKISDIWVPGSSTLASRLVNTLEAAGIHTVADIVLFNRKQFKSIRNVGGHIWAAVETYLSDNGLSFGMNPYRYGVTPSEETITYYENTYDW